MREALVKELRGVLVRHRRDVSSSKLHDMQRERLMSQIDTVGKLCKLLLEPTGGDANATGEG